MKKFICIACLACIAATCGHAQERTVTLPEKPVRGKYVDYSNKGSGWWLSAQLHGGVAATNNDDYAGVFQLDVVNGYRFSEFLKVGIGFAPRIYTFNDTFPLRDNRMIFGIYSLPVYADVRGNITSQEDTMFAPYWVADLGYSINEGVYISPGVGIKVGGTRNNLLVGVRYTLQGHNTDSFSGVIHLFSIGIGYEF